MLKPAARGARAAGPAASSTTATSNPPIPARRRVATGTASALVVAVGVALALAGCENKSERAAAPVAAKINGDVITVQQIEHVVQQQRGLEPDQVEAASRLVLQRLVEQQLAVRKAQQLELDREPRVVQQLDAARREVLARAYFDKAGEAATKPSAEEMARYYEEHPALFAQRRIYSLQEFQIEARADQVEALKGQLTQAKNINQFIEILKANGLRFSGAQAVRSAEQLPIASLGAFAAMKDGQALLNASPGGAQLIVLAGSRAQPVTLEQATPAIEQFLLNARKRELVAAELKSLRDAARIEYVGAYADTAATGAPPSAAPSFAPNASEEASAAR